jgi:ATP-dependent Clp protease adaptor protein ClpS
MADSDVGHDTDVWQDTDTQQDTIAETHEAVEPPAKIFIHNDDVTPYDFVVTILQRFFGLNLVQAEYVTFLAHTTGVAYVTTLPQSEAEKKVGQAQFAAGLEGYPLQFTIESE